MNTPQEFEEQLVALLHQKPFQPFIVEYDYGESFEVDAPYVAHSGGAAGYISPDEEIYFFNWKNVRQFIPGTSRTPS